MKISGDCKRWRDYFGKVYEGNIETLDEVIKEYKDLVKSSFNDVSDFEIKSSLGLVTSLNTPNDDCTQIINEIKNKYSPQNVIPSGIRELDEEFLSGGYQPSRIYLYAGISGVGKSILLMNSAIRGAMSGLTPLELSFASFPTLSSGPQRLFLYITLENYVYETWMRFYCALTKKTKGEMLAKLRDASVTSKDIQNEIEQILGPYNCAIQVEYFPSNTISPGNIAALIQKYNRSPLQRVVKAVYVDYLDLLQPDEKGEMYRLDLGAIMSRLKIISASFEIPIITATQLNREAYRKEKDKEFGIETVSESIHKVFIADFGAVIQRVESPENGSNGDQPPKPVKAILKVEKNRDGKTGKTNLYFDYPRSRILTNEEYMDEFGEVMKI
jgi:replicative DNA helicase